MRTAWWQTRATTDKRCSRAGASEELSRRYLADVIHYLAIRPDTQGQCTGTALLAAHHATFDW